MTYAQRAMAVVLGVLLWCAAALPAAAQLPRTYVDVGLNWFGLETTLAVPGGVTRGLSVPDQLAAMRRLGFTAVRLPVSARTIAGVPTPESARRTGYPADSRDGLLYVLAAAERADMRVLLTHYNYDPALTGPRQTGTPISAEGGCSWCHDGEYSQRDWLNDLETLARVAARFDNVIGIEPWNEPHALNWNEWRPMVERAGQRILAANPNLDIYVIGTFGNDGDNWSHWGEWHRGMLETPIDPAMIPYDHLVLAAHTYSPQFTRAPLDPKPYHIAENFPANMPAIWDAFFGEAAETLGLRLSLTEFAFGRREALRFMEDAEEVAFSDALFIYLRARGFTGPHFFWAWNPDSADTMNIILPGWDGARADLVQRLVGPRG